MTATDLARLLLRLDAAANVALATATLALMGPVAEAAGLGTGWPLAAVAVALIGNGVACWQAASAAAPRTLRVLAVVDVVFTLVVLAFVLAAPTGAAAWLRMTLLGLAVVVAAVAAAKALLAARFRQGQAVIARPMNTKKRL